MPLTLEIEVQGCDQCETLTLEIIDAPVAPSGSIDDAAGLGDTGVTWSADKSSRELVDKVDKVAGLGLSELSFTTEDKNSLDQSEQDRHTHANTSVIADLSDDGGVLQYKGLPISGGGSDPNKVDKVAGYSLVADTEIAKLLTVQADATKNATDAELRDRATHTGEQAIDTVTGLQGALDSKVDKVAGKQLSDESFTLAEKTKLSNIETEATKNRTDAATDALLLTKVDKVAGSSLITDAEKSRLSTVVNFDNSGNVSALATKVDKEAGKSLIADSEISRLASVSNYNDAPLALRVANLESSVGNIDTALAAILGVTP